MKSVLDFLGFGSESSKSVALYKILKILDSLSSVSRLLAYLDLLVIDSMIFLISQ